MKPLLTAALGTILFVSPLAAQQPDYLTPEEVELARETQEPNRRLALFLDFAKVRLERLEKTFTTPADQPPPLHDVKDLLNDFIRALDDTFDKLEEALQRGGADLRKSRALIAQQGEDIRARLARLRHDYSTALDDDLRYDFESAAESLASLIELGSKIPDKPIPASRPGEASAEANAEAQLPPPGQPSLRRSQQKRKEKEKKPN